jgi:hypothetical protein
VQMIRNGKSIPEQRMLQRRQETGLHLFGRTPAHEGDRRRTFRITLTWPCIMTPEVTVRFRGENP